MNLGSIYGEYFQKYSSYFGRALKLMKSRYGMTNSGTLFFDEFIDWLIEEIFFNINARCLYIISMHQMGKHCCVILC